jgi:hypothetical protein
LNDSSLDYSQGSQNIIENYVMAENTDYMLLLNIKQLIQVQALWKLKKIHNPCLKWLLEHYLFWMNHQHLYDIIARQ